MDAMKDLVAVVAGIVGLATTVLTLYAKYLDVKKSAASAEADATKADLPTGGEPVPARPEPWPAEPPAFDPATWYAPPVSPYLPPLLEPRVDPKNRELIRDRLRAPAIAMIAAGVLSLFFNMVVAGYGFVNEFVTPLSEESRVEQANRQALKVGDPRIPPGTMGSASDRSEKATAVIIMFVLMGLSLPCAVAIMGGIGMLRLQGYWVSVAGAFAIMVGASFSCCMMGIPIGAWSLWALFRPDVASAFR